jgi:hypothetical protein
MFCSIPHKTFPLLSLTQNSSMSEGFLLKIEKQKAKARKQENNLFSKSAFYLNFRLKLTSICEKLT